MSKKYVIEIKPEYEDSFKGVMILGAKDSNLFVDTLAVDELEELNSDYINEHYGDLQDTAYQRGLDAAWEAARKIAGMWETIDNEGLLEIFGLTAKIGESTIGTLFNKQAASEAIAKLKAYEEKQKAEDEIKVGDEVIYNEHRFIVFATETEEHYASLFDVNGRHASASQSQCKKTGRHFDIDKILEEMKE